MDILNWVYLIKNKFTRTTVENPATDLVVLGADVSYQKRGDKYQNYVMTVENFLKQVRPYKVYSALLTQSGTNPPVATVLENTLDAQLDWYYASAGRYYAESYGTWTLNKTAMTVGPLADASNGAYVQTKIDSEDQAYVVVKNIAGAGVDNSLSLTFVEIRVYN